MATATKARKQTEITSPTVNRVICKTTKQVLGYLVKSNSSDEYYQVTWNYDRKQYECTCKAGKHGLACSHVVAVSLVCKARKQYQEQVKAEQCGLSMSPTADSAEKFLKKQQAPQTWTYGTCGHRVAWAREWDDCGCRS